MCDPLERLNDSKNFVLASIAAAAPLARPYPGVSREGRNLPTKILFQIACLEA